MAKKQKYYVVWSGRKPGIYTDWPTAQAQVVGVAGARYRSYSSRTEAEAAYQRGYRPAPKRATPTAAGTGTTTAAIIYDSLSVDAACSGNPGPMEYQGVQTQSGERIFHQAFPLGTNNIGEFLAIVHALALLQKQQLPTLPIYTDSATAIKWVKNRQVKTKLVRNDRTEQLYTLIARAEQWLQSNRYQNPILKWETERWGEIPADFGRK